MNVRPVTYDVMDEAHPNFHNVVYANGKTKRISTYNKHISQQSNHTKRNIENMEERIIGGVASSIKEVNEQQTEH